MVVGFAQSFSVQPKYSVEVVLRFVVVGVVTTIGGKNISLSGNF